MVNTSVSLCGIRLDNPIIPASGTFGYGQEFAQLYDLDCLGSFSCKGTTLQPRLGNPAPRIAEGADGMLNSVGLQNPGIDAVIAREMPEIAKIFHKPIVANICGFSTEEYIAVAERFDACEQVGWLELNISCPNVHGGGMGFGTTCESAAAVTKAVKRHTRKPLIVKLTPNVTDIAAIAKACEGAGADGISLINTILAMRIDPATRAPILANVTGGLSGAAVFPVAVRMVWQVYNAVSIPIIGMGGVRSARDVIEMMLAGATCVGVGAENLRNPFAARDIVAALPEEMAKYNIDNLSDIIGGAHHG